MSTLLGRNIPLNETLSALWRMLILTFDHLGKIAVDTGFVDLDIIITKIRNGQSKAYFLDAVKAYKAGALRGTLTSAWVALVDDLEPANRPRAIAFIAAFPGFLATAGGADADSPAGDHR